MGFVLSSCHFYTFLGHILVHPQPPWHCCETTLTLNGPKTASTQATTRESLQLHQLKVWDYLNFQQKWIFVLVLPFFCHIPFPPSSEEAFLGKRFFFPKRPYRNMFLYTSPSHLCSRSALSSHWRMGFSNLRVQSPHMASTVFAIIKILFQDLLVNFQLSSYSMGICAWAHFSFT